MFDSRENPRIGASIPVAIRFQDGEATEGWGRLLDISMTGARLESRWPHRVGQNVDLHFEIEEGLVLRDIKARVTRVGWKEGYYQVGLAFDTTPLGKARLREALTVLLNRDNKQPGA